MKISRRTLLRSAAIGAAGVAAPALITRYGWAQTGPIKLGMVEPMSGPNRYFGESRTDAVRLVVEDGLPYQSASWHLWRDHRVFVPYATIQNWVEAGGKKGGRSNGRLSRLGAR